MILAQAIEAAAKAIAETGTAGWVKGEWDDPDIAEKLRDEVRVWATAALESAAPYLRFDSEPQAGDGPDYHTEHAFWLARNASSEATQ